jgi:hypothetical protein
MPSSMRTACRSACTSRPGQASDKTAAPILLDALPPGTVVADRGYDSKALVRRVAARGGEAHIPTQSRVRRQRTVRPTSTAAAA